jgi:hypothetical protein
MPRNLTSPDDRKRALTLLAAGKVALPELAQVMGVSTQVLWNWCRAAGVNWRKARLTAVMREWKRK